MPDHKPFGLEALDFMDLQNRVGADDARAVLRALEQMEGVSEGLVANLSLAERFSNVLTTMQENMRVQTRH